MMKVTEKLDWYLSNFQTFEKNFNGEAILPVHKIRKAAIARFAELGFPTIRDEEWKFTDVSPIVKRSFKPVLDYRSQDLTAQEIEEFTLGDPAGRLYALAVFVNGHYSEELSLLPPLPQGTVVGSLAKAFKKDPETVEQHLARYARYDENGFTALNTAFIQDGAFVYIPSDVVIEKPIHLLFISVETSQQDASTTGEIAPLSQPRNLIITGRNSQVTLVESYVNLTNSLYFTNAITEIVAGESAVIDHYKLQNEGEKAFHIGMMYVHHDRQSNFSSNSLSFGGALVRNDVTILLDAEGAECTLNGLYVVTGRQHVDNHTVIDHIKPHCTSRELYKGVLDEGSRGVFNGKILVRQGAQKTNAHQTNKNLLLSDNALIDTKPQLEIFNNDVKCTHGATIGQLEEEAIFYLRSRGIEQEVARTILIYAFASDVINRIKPDSVRAHVDKILLSRFEKYQG